MIQSIPTDGRRMFHLPRSIRDAIVDLTLPPLTATTTTTTTSLFSSGCPSYFDDGRSITRYNHPRRRQRSWKDRTKEFSSSSSSSTKTSSKPMSMIRLLSQPRIVGAATPTTTSSSHAFFQHSTSGGMLGGMGMSCKEGISCMDLDRGNDAHSCSGSSSSSPPRYLLVGSGGGDCSIAVYDLSCFGSDSYLYHENSSSQNNNLSSLRKHRSNEQSLWTHRPIARSLRHHTPLSSGVQENIVNGIPSGHRHPLRGVHWYPGEFVMMMMMTMIRN